MPGPTPHYPPEFKREAVKLYRSSGQSIPKVAKELGIADESLRRWIRQHEIDEGERDGLTTEERQELSRLRRENKTLRRVMHNYPRLRSAQEIQNCKRLRQ